MPMADKTTNGGKEMRLGRERDRGRRAGWQDIRIADSSVLSNGLRYSANGQQRIKVWRQEPYILKIRSANDFSLDRNKVSGQSVFIGGKEILLLTPVS